MTNNAPVFTSSSSFSVQENSVSVGTVVASDPDSEDSNVAYSISGGADRFSFQLGSQSSSGAVLVFVQSGNFESPVDVGGNNVYNLVVTATSGTGGRVRTATQAITVL